MDVEWSLLLLENVNSSVKHGSCLFTQAVITLELMLLTMHGGSFLFIESHPIIYSSHGKLRQPW